MVGDSEAVDWDAVAFTVFHVVELRLARGAEHFLSPKLLDLVRRWVVWAKELVVEHAVACFIERFRFLLAAAGFTLG